MCMCSNVINVFDGVHESHFYFTVLRSATNSSHSKNRGYSARIGSDVARGLAPGMAVSALPRGAACSDSEYYYSGVERVHGSHNSHSRARSRSMGRRRNTCSRAWGRKGAATPRFDVVYVPATRLPEVLLLTANPKESRGGPRTA